MLLLEVLHPSSSTWRAMVAFRVPIVSGRNEGIQALVTPLAPALGEMSPAYILSGWPDISRSELLHNVEAHK